MRDSREKLKRRKKWNSQDRQQRATFCLAQSRDVRRRGVDRELLVTESKQKADFTWISQLYFVTAFASTVVSFSRLTTLNTLLFSREYSLLQCPLPVLASAVHYMSAEPKKKPASNVLLLWIGPWYNARQTFLEVLLICCLFQKTEKYCSFKYCALHRIFCHKLVNIYIFFFQYSDIYFHIYRTIKCFCSLFVCFFLLFFF